MAPHLDRPVFEAMLRGEPLSGRDAVHLDRCVTCRKTASAAGISDALIDRAARSKASPRRTVILTASVAAALGIAVVATPLRGTALGFFTMFQPRTVAAVPLTMEDFASFEHMPDLGAYATQRVVKSGQSVSVTNVRAASLAAGFPIREPSNLPATMRATSYAVQGEDAMLYSFSGKQKAGAHATAPLPADIAGSTLFIDLGARAIVTYQIPASAADESRMNQAFARIQAQSREAAVDPRRQAFRKLWLARRPDQHYPPIALQDPRSQPRQSFLGDGELPLVVFQMPSPRVSSTGVSMQRLVSYLLDQPGISPHAAAAFRSLGDLSSTLPIPIPIDKAYTQDVWVDGVKGVGIGDDTGLGAAVIWQKNGMLYAVMASKPASDVLAIANSLR